VLPASASDAPSRSRPFVADGREITDVEAVQPRDRTVRLVNPARVESHTRCPNRERKKEISADPINAAASPPAPRACPSDSAGFRSGSGRRAQVTKPRADVNVLHGMVRDTRSAARSATGGIAGRRTTSRDGLRRRLASRNRRVRRRSQSRANRGGRPARLRRRSSSGTESMAEPSRW